MSLPAGTRMGPYEIVAPIGAGGMGEVYRARDTRLARVVAIKVLSSELTASESRERFRREAKAISSLAHPNICVLYDVGHDGGIDFLVMEHLTGEPLSARLSRGALPLDQVLQYGIEIAAALDHAHRNGIIHRDLKPGNVLITKSGAKLLDFGIARSISVPVVDTAANTSAPTAGMALTAAGSTPGTLEFMAPEQLEGKQADARSDIFAFGNILYRMATGVAPFPTQSSSSLVEAIRHQEPKSVSDVAPQVPHALARLITACMKKDPDLRIQSALDCKLALEWIRDAVLDRAMPSAPSRSLLKNLALAAAALVLIVTTAFVVRRKQTPAAPVRRFSVELPGVTSAIVPPKFAISPDGSRIAIAGDVGNGLQLYTRTFDQNNLTALPQTADAIYPFFSPDGEWIGFAAGGKLKKIRFTGGAPITICDAPRSRGASWGPDDTIVFAPASTDAGLYRVAASGGIPKALTFLDGKKNERSHRWPRFLPDGKHVLFTIDDWGANYATKRVAVVDVTTGKRTTLIDGGCDARFVPGGFLAFARDRALYAVKFDPAELRVSGLPVPILDRVMTHIGIGFSYVDFSSDGTLLYAPVDAASTSLELVLTDRKGVSTSLSRRRGEFVDPVLSPDGQQLVVGIGESRATDLWLVNIARDSWSRIAPEGQSLAPVWSPRGDQIFYSSNRAGTYNIYSMPANGQGPVTQITNREYWPFTRSVSADGRTLIMEVQHPLTSNDLWLVDLATHKESPLLTSRANEEYGVMSPDGRWFAYASNETGKYEVYVQHLPPTGRKWSVSENGGILPRWSADGREIFFRNDDKVMVAPVRTQPALVIETPRLLFENEYSAEYDVFRDAQHFVMLREKSHPVQLNVVLNWFEDVRRRVAVAYDRQQ